jgi:hypothetical protein
MAKHKKRGKKFPWLVAGGAAAVAALLFWPKDAGAAVIGTPGPQPPTPPGGIPPGTYAVTTTDTGTAGQLALRSGPSTAAPVVEWLPHLSTVQASGVVSNGFAAVMAPDGQSGYASLSFLTKAA